MRSFLVLATLAFVAVQVSQVYSDSSSSSDSSDSSDSHGYGSSLSGGMFGGSGHHGLHLNRRELSMRHRIIVRIQQYSTWNSLSVIRQERLMNAIMRDYSVPSSWQLNSWSDILNRSYATRVQQIFNSLSVLESLIDDLPHGQNESLVVLAQSQSWWSSLATWQQRLIAVNILRNQNIPLGYSSWSEALNSSTLSSGSSTLYSGSSSTVSSGISRAQFGL